LVASHRHPELLQTVLDTPRPRELAEFYRRLLGYEYRPGDEDGSGEGSNDWLVLTDSSGIRKLAFQVSPETPAVRWPDGPPHQMMHLDLRVASYGDLLEQCKRSIELGAKVVRDASSDPVEPNIVMADVSGHLYCLIAPGNPS